MECFNKQGIKESLIIPILKLICLLPLKALMPYFNDDISIQFMTTYWPC